MPKRTPQDWETLEQELHAAGVSPAEIEAGARRLLAKARGHQLAEARKQLGLAQRDIAASMGVSIARVSQIEHGEVTSFEVIARYVEALGGRLDLVADFGDRTVRLPVSDTATIRGYVSIPTDQAWFFTPEWLAGEREADVDITAGRGTVHESAEDMFDHLDSLGSADE